MTGNDGYRCPVPGRQALRRRFAVRKLIDIRSTAILLAFACVALITVPAHNSAAVTSRPAIYPFGWWDDIQAPERLPSMRSTGMNAVLPYTSLDGRVKDYLDRAHKQGLKVFVQIDPTALIVPNPLLARAFVTMYKSHPALYGWLLVDEPTVHVKYAALTPAVAKVLYREIKSADPDHPVGIAFGVSEDPKPWVDAMDILMYDDYVTDAGKPEFWGLGKWRARLRGRAAMAAKLDGYIPILQAFGEDVHGRPQISKRLPTAKEMRYMTYSAIQFESTGLLFWVRYRSRTDWITKVLTPLSKEIAPALKAIAAKPVSGATVVGSAIVSRLYRDPSTKALYLVAVHHGSGTVKAQINLSSSLKVVKAIASDHTVVVSGGKLVDTYGPYQARLFKLSS